MGTRKMIDGHVHLFPDRLLGTTDENLGIKWEKNGQWIFEEGFTIQRMPPYFEDSKFNADTIIATMDAYGVEKAVVMQSYMFRVNQDLADAIAKYPGRIKGAMFIDPRDEDVLQQIRHWNSLGINVIKFEMKGYTNPKAYPEIKLNAPDVTEVLDEAERLGLTITIDTDEVDGAGYQVEELREAIEKHPKLHFVICHLGFAKLEYLADQKKYARWQEMVGLARYDNVWIDIAAMSDLFLEEGYPFESARKMLKYVIDLYGDDKPIWGSDMPGTFNTATYREMVEMYEKDPDLSENTKDKIFYENAVKAYKL